MKNIFLLTSSFISIAFCVSSEKEYSIDDYLLWKSGRLDFSDFKSHPAEVPNIAVSYVTFTYECFCGQYSVSISSVTIFDRTRSWIKDKSNHIVLEHEQLHFDIAEVSRRKFAQRILLDTLFDSQNSANHVLDIYNEALAFQDSLHKAFDAQYHNNSLITWETIEAENIIWRNRVDSMLSALGTFSDDIIERPIP